MIQSICICFVVGKRCHFIHDERPEQLERLRQLNSEPSAKKKTAPAARPAVAPSAGGRALSLAPPLVPPPVARSDDRQCRQAELVLALELEKLALVQSLAMLTCC